MTKFLTLISIGISICSFGQGNLGKTKAAVHTPSLTNIQRYNIEYKLDDESILGSDSTILNTIDLDRLEFVRKEQEDVVFYDKDLNLDVIVFSFEKIRSKKSNHLIIKK